MLRRVLNRLEDRSRKYPRARLDFFRTLPADARILELGCGSGGNCGMVRDTLPESEIHGIDVKKSDRIPNFVHYKKVDLNKGKLPYEDASFDALLLIHVIEHLSNPFALGAEFRRILKPGGQIFVETPNWTSMLVPSFGFKREQSFPFNFFDDPTHQKPWTKHGLFEFLSKGCGLDVETVRTRRDYSQMIIDPLVMASAWVKGKRATFLSSFTNVYGWNIYAIARRADA